MNVFDNFLFWLIISCEIGFWLFLFLGLVARYLLQWERISKMLLIAVPCIDIVLLVATIVDLRSGATATFAHGLAAIYIGFAVIFGSATIRWADAKFAYKFGGGPRPVGPPEYGWEAVKYDLKLWLQCILACFITYIILQVSTVLVANNEQTQALQYWIPLLKGTVFLWFVFGPLWSILSVKKQPDESALNGQ